MNVMIMRRMIIFVIQYNFIIVIDLKERGNDSASQKKKKKDDNSNNNKKQLIVLEMYVM